MKKPHTPKVIEVKKLSSFVAQIEKLVSVHGGIAGSWFRGVGSASTHKLTPTLYRHPTESNVENLLKFEATMLHDFCNAYVNQGANGATTTGGIRSLFFMQHYGIPTRLLDWTTNPFIALYFALTSAKPAVDDAAVWVLDPTRWNESVMARVSKATKGPLSYEDAEQQYGPYKLHLGEFDGVQLKSMQDVPACVVGVVNNARMFAQRGVFTMFGLKRESMEEQFSDRRMPKDCLAKLLIPRDQIQPLLSLLLKIGYTDSVSYPDLNGLVMEIRRTHGY